MFISAGAEISSLIVASIFLGKYIDEKLGTPGLFLIVFIILSFVGWFIRLVRLLNKKND